MAPSFSHRTHAGEVLARSLSHYARQPDVTVLAIPNGGVPIAFEVACSLAAPLDLFLFEPIVVPGSDATLGLLGWPPVQQLHEPVINALGITDERMRDATAQSWRQLRQRVHLLRPAALPPFISGRRVILVNEGVVSGQLFREAAGLLRRAGAKELIAAAPVGSREGLFLLVPDFDDIVCPLQPTSMDALPPFYEDFRPVTADEVRALLIRAWRDWGSLDTSPLGAS
jgi:predicted phosphoribosyltransferase